MPAKILKLFFSSILFLGFAHFILAFVQTDLEIPKGTAHAADVILNNGKVLTMNPQSEIAQAIAIQGDKIIAVGSDEQVLARANTKTEKIDLRGKTVIPGLTESHSHITGAAESDPARWNLSGCR
jgi:predicted amidohydrolase YtcJ